MRSDTGAVDAAIVAYLRRPDTESAATLAATGDAGARRVVGLWFDGQRLPGNPIPDAPARDAIDRWSAALSVVAAAAPTTFMDLMAGREADTLLLSILGNVTDQRATAILGRHVDDPNWLNRYNAVRTLGRSQAPDARPGSSGP